MVVIQQTSEKPDKFGQHLHDQNLGFVPRGPRCSKMTLMVAAEKGCSAYIPTKNG